MTVIYRHLRDPLRHVRDCTVHRCAAACEVDNFEQWLAKPVTRAEAAEEQRREQRLSRLLAGGA